MKLVYEIDSEKINLSVNEALEILAIAIIQERKVANGASCRNSCSQDPHFTCSRGHNHAGRHIAIGGIGSDLVFDIWKDGLNG
jgi:hypothetical protein